MNNRVAVIAIIAESIEASGEINALFHEFNSFIIGRMGLPYRERKKNIITIAVDAPLATINALSGKLGRIPGVTAKAVCSKEEDS